MPKPWLSYWYICFKCDASIEVVSKQEPKRSPTCTCGAKKRNIHLCQTSEHVIR